MRNFVSRTTQKCLREQWPAGSKYSTLTPKRFWEKLSPSRGGLLRDDRNWWLDFSPYGIRHTKFQYFSNRLNNFQKTD